jgi:dienelactone hydrolase
MTPMNEQAFSYEAHGQTYQGLLLGSELRKPRATVALLPDWRGQSALARDHARFLVDHDCAVAIADLYGGGFNPTHTEQVGPMVQKLLEHRDKGVAALSACVASLRQRFVDVPVFCLGYSAGGMVALDYGRSGAEVAGIVLCSALLKTALPAQPTRINAPVLILQGTQDVVSPMAVVDQLIAEMEAAHNDVRFVLYSQTHHAFDNPDAGTDPTARLVYSANAAAQSRATIAQFILELTPERD